MKTLIDTNVFIYREENEILSEDLQALERELRKEENGSWMHPKSVKEIRNDPNESRRRRAESRVESYPKLEYPPTPSPGDEFRDAVSSTDADNETVDDCLLYAVHEDEVDFLVTEDRGIHKKALKTGLQDRVFTIKEARRYFETGPVPISSAPDIERTTLGDVDLNDSIFDSLREEYDFNEWARTHSDRETWINRADDGSLGAVLVIKPKEVEAIGTNPQLDRDERLKISTFKVAPKRRGSKLGERLLSISVRRAVQEGVDKLYLTHYVDSNQDKLVQLLDSFGFIFASKESDGEHIYQKHLTPPVGESPSPVDTVKLYYPSFRDGPTVDKYFVPIQPKFHRKLFTGYNKREPTELEKRGLSQAEGNAVRKAYLSHTQIKQIDPGDILLFYRSQDHREVTTLCVCEDTHVRLEDPSKVKRVVGKRSVFSDDQIESMVQESPTTVFMFWWHFNLKNPVGYQELLDKDIINGAIRSTQSVGEAGYKYIKQEGGVDGRFARN
mgnify:CR=1 FL=1